MSTENLKEAILSHPGDLSDPQVTDEAATVAVVTSKDVTPKKKRKREKRPPDPTDPAVIAAKAAVHTAKLEAEAAAIAEAEEASIPTPMEEAKYYVSLVLGTLCIISAFTFLFLVPFILDPAISTFMHDFVGEPVTCKVSKVETKRGKSTCLWSSCREGCTVDMYTCWQVRVIYAPHLPYTNQTLVEDISDSEWIDLTRFDILENEVCIFCCIVFR